MKFSVVSSKLLVKKEEQKKDEAAFFYSVARMGGFGEPLLNELLSQLHEEDRQMSVLLCCAIYFSQCDEMKAAISWGIPFL